ncbi:MAG: sugar phosphate isomerase/epimerase [Clostridia bacterium]|nr:sugar phosphate isomerase/epimerase [Clostridia bacterium]
MLLCAQLYSVRDAAQTPEGIEKTFEKIHKIGYEGVQVSGLGKIEAQHLRDISIKTNLPIVCTHSPIDRILGDTDALIEEHKVYNCPVIGLGYLPRQYQGSKANLDTFLKLIEEPVKKIKSAGLDFAYHNHHFEFSPLPDSDKIMFDMMLENCPDWTFIVDTYWVEYAGYSAVEYMKKVGSERLNNVHYKDMAKDRSICACGLGTMNFQAITDACIELNVKNALVEQDNAVEYPDMFEQMTISFNNLRGMIK